MAPPTTTSHSRHQGADSPPVYSTILSRYRRQDERINQIVSAMFLRGVSTRMVGKISHLLWGNEVSPAKVSRMNKSVKKELIRWLNRPITQKIAYLGIDGAYFKVRRKRISREVALCAVGITEKGHREHLGFIQGHRESQQAWKASAHSDRPSWAGRQGCPDGDLWQLPGDHGGNPNGSPLY